MIVTVPIHLQRTADRYKFDVPGEMFHFITVMANGASKYKPNGWLESDGVGTSHKEMHASVCRHIADWYCGIKQDKDSGIDPRLHAACRLLMDYTRDQNQIINPKDLPENISH